MHIEPRSMLACLTMPFAICSTVKPRGQIGWHEICQALGLEFYVGPPREPGMTLAMRNAPVEMRPVADCDIARVLAALADEYEKLNDWGRRSLLTRFRAYFPDLAQREQDGDGRRQQCEASD